MKTELEAITVTVPKGKTKKKVKRALKDSSRPLYDEQLDNSMGLLGTANPASESAPGEELQRQIKGLKHAPTQTYYALMHLLESNPRALEVSELLTVPLLVPGKLMENYELVRILDVARTAGKQGLLDLGVQIDADLAALLLLLAGRASEIDFLPDIEESRDSRWIAELTVLRRVCQPTRRTICHPSFGLLLEKAYGSMPAFVHRARHMNEIADELCTAVKTGAKEADDAAGNTNLYPMVATWAQLFPESVHLIYQFPGEDTQAMHKSTSRRPKGATKVARKKRYQNM